MITELRNKLDTKQVSSAELTTQYLQRIKEKNVELNAYILVLEDYALEQAKRADDMIAQGKASSLTGIPYMLKDLFCVDGIETTACSKILQGYIPPYTGTAAHKIYDAGAVLLGKGNTDEFAMGASSEHSCFGPTRNPHDTERVAGGSSGGPAAAVAADLAAFSLGTDTGGSIRLPAAFCGVVGLRPTYGRVSRYGVIAMASSLDTVGPFAQTIDDLALVLEQIAGPDTFDSTTPHVAVPDYRQELTQPLKKLVIGIPKEYFEVDGLDDEVKTTIEAAMQYYESQGHTLEKISLPHTKYAVPTYYIIVSSEVSSNLARYDGIKYGMRSHSAQELIDIYKLSRSEGFGTEAKRRIMLGTYTLSAGYYDAYYVKAMKVRTLIRADFDRAFQSVDVILTPSTPTPAFKVGEKNNDPLQMYLEDIFTAPGSLAGIPGLNVPAGFTKTGLPIGIQLMGPQWSEGLLLQMGKLLEQRW